MSQKALFDGLFANLRPLKKSNMAKLSIVKWSLIWIYVVILHILSELKSMHFQITA